MMMNRIGSSFQWQWWAYGGIMAGTFGWWVLSCCLFAKAVYNYRKYEK